MYKKGIFTLTILALSLSILIPTIARALNTPTSATVDCLKIGPVGECIAGEASAKLLWTWDGGTGTLKQFKILFREQGSPTWIPKYPASDLREYNLLGLVAGTHYEWIIKAEAEDPSNDSAYRIGQDFYTDTSSGGGNGNGGNGNGGWPAPITINLVNPLDADTFEEAIDALTNILFVIAFAIAPVLLIYAGFLILFRPDDPKERNKARNIIFWVLIALAVVVLAKTLPAVIKGALSS